MVWWNSVVEECATVCNSIVQQWKTVVEQWKSVVEQCGTVWNSLMEQWRTVWWEQWNSKTVWWNSVVDWRNNHYGTVWGSFVAH